MGDIQRTFNVAGGERRVGGMERDPRRVRCYNCAGFGHVAYACVSPRLEKSCYNCGGPGHLAQDCRAAPGTGAGLICYRCQRTGHMARDCREPAAAAATVGPDRALGFGRREKTCYVCNRAGHLARDCPNPGDKTCYQCHLTGHIAKECPNAAVAATGNASSAYQ